MSAERSPPQAHLRCPGLPSAYFQHDPGLRQLLGPMHRAQILFHVGQQFQGRGPVRRDDPGSEKDFLQRVEGGAMLFDQQLRPARGLAEDGSLGQRAVGMADSDPGGAE